MEYTELNMSEIEKALGKRDGIMFRCGACMCGFLQKMRYIHVYDNGHRYIIQTECPNCKGIIAVTSDGNLY